MKRDAIISFLSRIGVLTILRAGKQDSVTVLSLHRVTYEPSFFWPPMLPETFRILLTYVTKYYRVILFRELENALLEKKGKPLLILSFDDGYYDFIEYTMPLLREFNIKANHNIVFNCAQDNMAIWTQRLNHLFEVAMKNGFTIEWEYEGEVHSNKMFKNWMLFEQYTYRKFLGIPYSKRMEFIENWENKLGCKATVKMMNWDDILMCDREGIEIGTHTLTHDSLSTLHDQRQLKHQVLDAIKGTEAVLGKPLQVLALPNAENNQGIYSILKETNIKFILHVGDRVNSLKQVSGPGIKDVYRINLVEESNRTMYMRMELFHTKLRKYV